jgi:hypothetical protein
MSNLIRERRAIILEKAQMHHSAKISIPENLKKGQSVRSRQRFMKCLKSGFDAEMRERAVPKVIGEKPTRFPRIIEKAGRDLGVQKGAGRALRLLREEGPRA